MDNLIPLDPESPRPLLTRIDPLKKVSEEQWTVIKSLAERGITYKEIGAIYGISYFTVGKRASREKWITPNRLSRAKNGTLAASNDPAHHVANFWSKRADDTREQVYHGAKKSLDRFFAMAPVPQSFSEAAIAHKLLKDAIDPSGSAPHPAGTTVNILTNPSFSPRPAFDV